MSYTKIRSIVFCIVLFILGLKVSGKGKDHFSIEVDANYYHYSFLGNSVNNFNYGFSLLGSKYMQRLKLSAGINYSTRFYQSPGSAFYSLEKRNYEVTYVNIPVIYSVRLISHKSFASSLSAGLLFTRVIKYNIASYYVNHGVLTEETDNRDSGSTLMFGITISRSLNNRFSLNLSPFGYYIIHPYRESTGRYGDYRTISVNRFYTGIKLGFEYSFN